MKGKPRRPDGEGSYGRTADGRHTYTKQIRLPDGTRGRFKAEGKTKAIARERCERKIAKALTPPPPVAPPLPRTVAEQLAYWMDVTHPVGDNLEDGATTRHTYRWVFDALIIPAPILTTTLGAFPLPELKTSHVKRWLSDLEQRGLAPKTVGMARSLLKAALNLAVQDELIVRNPVYGTKAPKIPRSSGKALSAAQARALLNAARGDRLEAAIRLALGLGLRRGEVCGLRWQDIDFAAGTLTVNGTITYTPETGLVYGPPKTPESRRTLDLPAPLLGALRWHQTRQQGERKIEGWEDTDYLFTAPSTGGVLNPNRLYATFQRIAKAAGVIGFRLHDLRHSAATFLIAMGVKVKRVQQTMGHATPTTTLNTYAHLLDGDDEDALERLQRLLGDDLPPADEDAEQKA